LSLIGGLISATLLTLLVLPAAYLWFVKRYGSMQSKTQTAELTSD